MKVIILTSSRKGTASRCLPALCASKKIEVTRVILAHGLSANQKRLLKKKIKKALKIGLFGALNGIRMRKWYADIESENIDDLCRLYSVPFFETPYINCDETRHLFRAANADLGLSLGNGYIPHSVFSIPSFGMVNVHGEILPDYQNAQSIIWPIYNGERNTGLTVHQIDSKIDTGMILYQERYPIIFCKSLRDTVIRTIKSTRDRTPLAVKYVCENYMELARNAVPQGIGRSYTTPSIGAFLRMIINNRKLFSNQKVEAL